jgi:hypothetical protein
MTHETFGRFDIYWRYLTLSQKVPKKRLLI